MSNTSRISNKTTIFVACTNEYQYELMKFLENKLSVPVVAINCETFPVHVEVPIKQVVNLDEDPLTPNNGFFPALFYASTCKYNIFINLEYFCIPNVKSLKTALDIQPILMSQPILPDPVMDTNYHHQNPHLFAFKNLKTSTRTFFENFQMINDNWDQFTESNIVDVDSLATRAAVAFNLTFPDLTNPMQISNYIHSKDVEISEDTATVLGNHITPSMLVWSNQ